MFLALVAANVITARAGLALHHVGDGTSLIWAPAGISLAMVILYGPWLLPAVAVASIITVLIGGHSFSTGVWAAFANVLEIGVAAYLLQRVAHLRPALDRVRDVLAFVLVAIATSLVASTMGAAGFVVTTSIAVQRMPELWATWWWGHLSAELVLTPLILTWVYRDVSARLEPRPGRVEAMVLVAALVIVAALAVSRQFSGRLGEHAPYYLIPILLWTGTRFGPFGASLATGYVSLLLIGGVALGLQPSRELSDLQSLVSVSSITGLILSALALERAQAIRLKAAVLQGALDAIITLDRQDRVVEFNPAAEMLFGFAAEDVLGKPLAPRLVLPELRDAYHALLHEHFEDTAPIGGRIRSIAVKSDGSTFPVEVAITRVAVGDEVHITGFVRDISAEQHAESARRASRELLEKSVDRRTAELVATNTELERREGLLRQAEALAHLGSFELDLESSTLKWSDELYRIHGVTPDDFVPSPDNLLSFIHPEDHQQIAHAIAAAMRDGHAFTFETRIVRPDGNVRILKAQAEVFVDVRGHVVRITGCSQDITERKNAEVARERLAELVESSEDAIIGLTLDGRIESWNPAAAKIFGFQADDILGQPFKRLVPEKREREVGHTLEQVLAGNHLTHHEGKHRRADGSLFDASVTVSVIAEPGGRMIGISKVLRDITVQKAAEANLRASLHEKEVLLREIHHRVKNNLQVISSLLNLQLASEPSEAGRRGLIESQSRVQSMALVHQLLYRSKDLAHIDLGEYLRGLATRLLATYQFVPEKVQIVVDAASIQLDIDRAIPCGLIVNELVTNSILHAFPGDRRGTIWLSVAQRDKTIQVIVRDDGVGLPPGTGVDGARTFGLQIASTLSLQLGGSIDIVPGDGTTATITIPLAAHTELG